MSSSFPSEVVREGQVSVIVPKLEAFVENPWEYAPSKAPVFYNPVMEFSRDLGILVLQEFQELSEREVSVCEPLTGCGIRGIRLAVEVDGVWRVVLNDLNAKAAHLARFNVERNNLSRLVSVANESANLLLSRHAIPRKRFDFIDIDPFGSPAPYLDSAVRALRNDGMLALTATDMAPLCGVHPKACIRKYGGKPLRTEYCHELAVRFLVGCLVMTAAKHEIGVEVMFSHSTDHYVRVYAIAHHGARRADKGIQEMGHMLHCFKCLHREKREGIFSPLKLECSECGSRLAAAGPLFLGKIFDEGFCASLRKELVKRKLKQEKKIAKLLSLANAEARAPVSYYVIDHVCEKLNLPIPPLSKVISELRSAGFQAAPTHFHSRGIRTDAPISEINAHIRRLVERR